MKSKKSTTKIRKKKSQEDSLLVQIKKHPLGKIFAKYISFDRETWLLLIFTLCFFFSVAFLGNIIFSLQNFETPSLTLSILLFFFFFLSACFFSLLALPVKSTKKILIVPPVLSLLAGIFIVGGGYLIFLLGIPFSLLFWLTRENAQNYLKFSLTKTVRKPFFWFFFVFFFFFSFFPSVLDVQIQILEQLSSPSSFQSFDKENEYHTLLLSSLFFLLLSPLSLLFSFFFSLGTYFIFIFLHMLGIFQKEFRVVQKEVIL